jgi:hypothetical protein
MKRFTTFVALFVCTMIISGSVVQLRAQGPTAVGGGAPAPSCMCTYNKCPDIERNPPYTRCPEPWAGASKVDFTIYLPLIDEFVDVEVHYCCRVRRAPCYQYVKALVQVSCETAITCIRVSKKNLLNYARPGEPLEPRELRQQLMERILQFFMCENPCRMGVPPIVGIGAYEWVFSFPACLYWDKTNDKHWCLTSCGDRYCIHAVAVRNAGYWGTDEDGNPVYKAAVVEHLTDQFDYTPRGCAVDRCTSDGCLESFKPDCSSFSGKVLWDLKP